jgi:hypothetical protein
MALLLHIKARSEFRLVDVSKYEGDKDETI